jgi:hypothetical protein
VAGAGHAAAAGGLAEEVAGVKAGLVGFAEGAP